jgi:isocitrate dehydrogenase (NAD+)
MMLDHIGQREAADRVRAGVRAVYAAGEHLTGDIKREAGANAHIATTTEFTQAVVDALATM